MATWIWIAITIMGFLTTEIGGLLWYLSGISQRVKMLEKKSEKLDEEVKAINSLDTRLAVVESSMRNMTDLLEEIRDELRK